MKDKKCQVKYHALTMSQIKNIIYFAICTYLG